MPTVREFMTNDLITISSDGSMEDAAQLMRTHDVGLLPVMEGKHFKGVVTDRDIVVKGLAEGRMQDKIGSIATKMIVSLAPGDDVAKAVRLMSETDVRRLPVCEDGELVGIVSVGDLATRTASENAGTVMEETGPAAR